MADRDYKKTITLYAGDDGALSDDDISVLTELLKQIDGGKFGNDPLDGDRVSDDELIAAFTKMMESEDEDDDGISDSVGGEDGEDGDDGGDEPEGAPDGIEPVVVSDEGKKEKDKDDALAVSDEGVKDVAKNDDKASEIRRKSAKRGEVSDETMKNVMSALNGLRFF